MVFGALAARGGRLFWQLHERRDLPSARRAEFDAARVPLSVLPGRDSGDRQRAGVELALAEGPVPGVRRRHLAALSVDRGADRFRLCRLGVGRGVPGRPGTAPGSSAGLARESMAALDNVRRPSFIALHLGLCGRDSNRRPSGSATPVHPAGSHRRGVGDDGSRGLPAALVGWLLRDAFRQSHPGDDGRRLRRVRRRVAGARHAGGRSRGARHSHDVDRGGARDTVSGLDHGNCDRDRQWPPRGGPRSAVATPSAIG